jgi:ArsR family transcriptional regulator
MLAQYVETLTLLGDESRLRLCALLRDRELRVTDLVRVTGISQPRVSSHLGRLKDAGYVQDRREGSQSFYTLTLEELPRSARTLLDEATQSADPTLENDQSRLLELEAERRGHSADPFADDIERDYSPGRSWHSLALGLAAGLDLGDVLDVGCGDGSASACVAPYCHSLTAVDTDERRIDLASERLARFEHAKAEVADVHALPYEDASFDAVLLFHTLTYAEHPERALAECSRVLRPGGRLVLLCLDKHDQQHVTRRFRERHPGFSPRRIKSLLARAGLDLLGADVACRENRRPHLQVVLGVAKKPRAQSPNPKHKASRQRKEVPHR